MVSRLAIKKLQAILIIDLIIIAFATGIYFYIRTLLEPNVESTDYRVYGLAIDPEEVYPNQTVKISAKVENLLNEAGNYSLNLAVNDEIQDNKTVHSQKEKQEPSNLILLKQTLEVTALKSAT